LPLTDYSFNEENAVDRTFYGRINIKKASSLLFYTENGLVKTLIHHLKYRNQEEIGSFFGDWYGQILRDDKGLGNIDVVVPVPLHRKKLQKRGYNQVTKFGQSLAYHLNAEYCENALIKTANTKTQTKKGRIGRWLGDIELYKLNDAVSLENRSVLLVDDVITTGATIEICGNTLQQVKGLELYVTSMAIVPLTKK